jgi:hypothetical protein
VSPATLRIQDKNLNTNASMALRNPPSLGPATASPTDYASTRFRSNSATKPPKPVVPTLVPSHVGTQARDGVRPRAPLTSQPATPVGGNIRDCLSSDDLDGLLAPWLKDHYVDARLLFDIKNKCPRARDIASGLVHRLKVHRWLFLPAHTRHHWASAIIWLDGAGRAQVDLYDSAPSACTRKDFQRIFDKIGFYNVRFASHARQPRDSNDCGLHMVWIAAFQKAHAVRPQLLEASGSFNLPSRSP